MRMGVITFVTGNQNKLKEVQAILGSTIPMTNKSLDRTPFTRDCAQQRGRK